MDPIAVAIAVAARQHQTLASWQLRWLGVPPETIKARVRREGWSRPFTGVVQLPGADHAMSRHAAGLLAYSAPTGAGARVDALRRRGAAIDDALVSAAMGAGAALGGRSAAWLHGLRAAPPPVVAVRLRAGRNLVLRPGVEVWRRLLPGQEVRVVAGLPVIDVVSAIFDVGRSGDEAVTRHHELTGLLVAGHALRKLTLETVRARLEAAGPFHGRGPVESALRDVEGQLSHSRTEGTARRLATRVLARRGLALHPRPFAITLAGRVVGEADLACVPLRLDLEVDGPHHRLPQQQELDRRRDQLVRQAAWTVERFPVELVDLHPGRFERQVSELAAWAEQALAG